ncbi:hypothetical protein M9H77_11697 [Catharanthus roseus]|uniref:Uncharacterized protein n=1 Tax=Catharanthus roseus TaxID=4058 RepID=A0ACC0BFH8_CATRO|nr:hypothetical protein M9H77_11697 [Catharanthus roseus]
MLHKTDKDLPTIIHYVKGVRIVLERDRQASILGIPDNGNTIIVDSNRRGNFPSLLPRALTYFFGHTLVQKGADLVKSKKKQWISSSEEDRSSFLQPVEDDDEAEASDDEEDEAGVQNTILMDAFQTEMQITFEQLRINQEVQGMQLIKIV